MSARFAPKFDAYEITGSAYAASSKPSPAAGLAAAAVAGGLLSSFLFMNAVIERKGAQKPMIVELLKMPEQLPEPRKRQVEPRKTAATPQIVAPTPRVTVPEALPPVVAATATPSPPAPIIESAAPASAALPATSAPEPTDLTGNLISARPPAYPIESRRLREQGTVVLAVQVSTEGRVDELSIAKSSGYFRLDRAALHAVRHWRWSPFRHHGNSVVVRGQVTIPFVLTT